MENPTAKKTRQRNGWGHIYAISIWDPISKVWPANRHILIEQYIWEIDKCIPVNILDAVLHQLRCAQELLYSGKMQMKSLWTWNSDSHIRQNIVILLSPYISKYYDQCDQNGIKRNQLYNRYLQYLSEPKSCPITITLWNLKYQNQIVNIWEKTRRLVYESLDPSTRTSIGQLAWVINLVAQSKSGR